MSNLATYADANPERTRDLWPWIPRHETIFTSEEASAAEFDRRVTACGLFERSFSEVNGYYVAYRPNRERKTSERRGEEENAARIDRVLLPGPKLRELGWNVPIGVELKKSDADFGHTIAQAIDYTYCIFNVGPYWMHFERIFVWPFEMPGGPLQSVMLQNGVGVVHGRRAFGATKDASPGDNGIALNFRLERNNLVISSAGEIEECHAWASGNKKGSR